MAYTLVNTELLVANEDIRCDGIAAYYDVKKQKPDFEMAKAEDMMPIIINKTGMISAGKKYYEYSFSDEDGQGYILNISRDMNPVIKRNLLFTEQIKNQICQKQS